jgi:hypothetical protein
MGRKAVDSNELFVAASIGISVYPDDGNDFDEIFKNDDVALYHAKDTANARPLRVTMANVGESLDLLAQYGGLDPATKGKPEDWVTLEYLP